MFQAVKSRINNFLSPIVEHRNSEIDNENIVVIPKQRKRRFQVETDCLQTPPDKRKKLSKDQSQSSFKFFESWNFKFENLFRYVVTGKKCIDDKLSTERPTESTSMTTNSWSSSRTCLTAARKKSGSRAPLSQISNSTVLDLTNIDDEDDSDSVTITKVVTDLIKPPKHKYDLRRQVGSLARQKSTGFLDKNVRLDEKKRYKELLAQFTTISLPGYSESISPTINRTVEQTPNVNLIKSHSLITDAKAKHILLDLTKNEDKASPPRRKFYHEHLHQSKSASSILEYSQLGVRNKMKTRSEAPEYIEVEDYTFSETTNFYPKGSTLLGSDWISKWRHTLDPLQLERDRQIQEEERKKEALKKKQKEVFDKFQEELEKSKANEFPELSEEMLATVKQALSPARARNIFVRGFNAEISGSDLSTLKEATWLNDEVVNFYFNLLKERSETDTDFLNVHVFNTFFYPKIVKTGHAGVKRWTRKVDIFSYDLILIPVHLGMHWCLAVVDFKNKQIAYYDSLKGNNMQCIAALKKYLQDESLDKKKTNFDFDDWSEIMPKDIPEQLNGCDCGVFMCKYAEYKSRNATFTFKQAHMPYFRKRMIYEIISKKLL